MVFLGDSIIQWWLDLAEYFPEVKVAKRGIVGDTSRGALIRLEEERFFMTTRAAFWAAPERSPARAVAEELIRVLEF